MPFLMTIFVVVFILMLVGGYVPRSNPATAPYWAYGHNTLLMIELGILGYVLFTHGRG